jgi:endonuclease/exonuclease/phosphatase (EEP) superfamily protein YafD
MKILQRLIQSGIVVIAVSSVLGYSGSWHQLLELFNHFRLQYWWGAALGLIAMALMKRWRWSWVAAAVLVLNSFHLVPWFFPSSNAGQATGQRLKLLQSNVKYSSTQYEKVLAYIAEEAPDIVTLQEVDKNWLANLGALQTTYPYSQFEAEATGSGIALYSKIKPEQLARINLGLSWRPGLQVDFKLGETLVHLVTIHPPTPTEPPNFRARNQQFAEVTQHLLSLPAPKILIGDLNDTVWSTYHAQMLAQTQMVNARQGFGLLPSWPSWLFFKPLMIPIDQCLLSPEITVAGIKTGPNIGSDHLPLVVELVVPKK